jgi:hypothetical protein
LTDTNQDDFHSKLVRRATNQRYPVPRIQVG